nr:hypothetical protein [uncultured Cohaesibacter sp.]
MKLTAIALPLLVAFTVCQPAQAQNNSQTDRRYYGSGNPAPTQMHRPGQNGPQARPAARPTVQPRPQVDSRQDRITRTIRKYGFYDIQNFVRRGDVASLTARDKEGTLFNLKIDSRSGLILKSWRIKETRPAPRHSTIDPRPAPRYVPSDPRSGNPRAVPNQWRPNDNRDFRYPRQGYYDDQRSGDFRYRAYYSSPYGYYHRDRTPFWSY